MSFEGKASRKLANGQNIEDSEKRKWPKGFICPCTGVKYHNIQTCLLPDYYWYMQQISGERLPDHWSSGSMKFTVFTTEKTLCIMHGQVFITTGFYVHILRLLIKNSRFNYLREETN